MRAIYMGKSKPSAVAGLRYLVERGVDVVAVVAPRSRPTTPGHREPEADLAALQEHDVPVTEAMTGLLVQLLDPDAGTRFTWSDAESLDELAEPVGPAG